MIKRPRKLPPGEAAFNSLYAQYRRGARIRGREFTLSTEEFNSIVTSNCHYCKRPPSSLSMSTQKLIKRRHNGNFTYSGVDRKDNNIGYVLGNCLPCCTICNHAKHNLSYDEYIRYLTDLVNNRSVI